MKTVEQRYPDARARRVADAVVDGMSLDETMLAYIIAYENAYLAAGGKIIL